MTRRGRGGPGRPRRRLAARALVILMLTAAGTAIAAPAWAITIPNPFAGTCKSQPVPQPPGTGMAGYLELKPSPLPAPAQAFGPNAASTEYVQYGYAGLTWSMYDMGCVTNPVTWWGPMVDNAVGNTLLAAARTIVATDNTLHDWASDPAWMATLAPLVGGANSALYKALFVVWAGAAMMTVGISIGLRAHRSDMPGSVTLATWALFVITLVAGVVAAPAWAGEQASALMGSTLNTLDAGFGGPGAQANAAQAHASLTVSAVLYPAWLRGEFGDPESPAAQQYGAALFQAQALTWSQAAASPQQLNTITKADQAKWAGIATVIQKNDPQLYPDIQGLGSSRAGAGVLALLTAMAVCAYDLIASLVIITALLGVEAGVIMLPALAVVGMHHRMRHLIIRLGSRIFGMLLNALLWAAGAGVDDLAARFLLTHTEVTPVLALLILLLLPIALWMMTRVLRGRPAVPRIVTRAATLGLGYALLRGGARAGARQGVADAAGATAATGGPGAWTWTAGPVGPPPLPPLGGGGGGGGGPLPPPGGGGGGGGGGPLPPPGGGSPGGGPLPPPGGGNGPRPLPPPGGGNGPRPLPPPGGGNGPRPLPPPGGGNGPRPLPPPGGGPGPWPRPAPVNGSGPGPGGGPLPPPSGNGNGPRPLPPPAGDPAGSGAGGPREYTGPRRPAVEVVPYSRIYGPGESYDGSAAGTYDGGGSANASVPLPSFAVPPAAGPVPRLPAGTWQQAARAPSGRPANGKRRVWIEEADGGVYVLVQGAMGISRTQVADGEQAEIAARQAQNWAWG